MSNLFAGKRLFGPIVCLAVIAWCMAASITSANFGVKGLDGSSDTFFATGSGFHDDVLDMALQSDGKLIIVGEFNMPVGISAKKILRLKGDGNIDSTFVTGEGANAPIYAVRILPDDKILIAGAFTTFDGRAAGRIVRLQRNGQLDPTFDPGSGASSDIYSLTLLSDGRILVGGQFPTFNETTTGRVARLDADGALDPTFALDQTIDSGSIRTIEVQKNGKYLLGGDFRYGDQDQGYGLAALSTDGSLDTQFIVKTDSTVQSVVDSGSGIFIGGTFTSVNLVARKGIARLTSTGSVDTSFVPTDVVRAAKIAVQPDGRIMLAGLFDGLSARTVGRIHIDGSLDETFARNERDPIHSVLITTDGKVLVAGYFRFRIDDLGGAEPAGVLRLNINGSRDISFITRNGYTDAEVSKVVLQSDGKMLISGSFNEVGGMNLRRIARLTSDGTLDAGFVPPGDDFTAMASQPDGKIIVGGNRSPQAGTFAIHRLNSDGTIDPTFSATSTSPFSAISNINDILVRPDGKVFVVGNFEEINGFSRKSIVRLEPDGSIDNSFDPKLNYDSATIHRAVLLPSGGIAVAGVFRRLDKADHILYRLGPGGVVESSTNIKHQFETEFTVADIDVQNDGRVVIVGGFNEIQNVPWERLARINLDGSLDTTFVPPALQGAPSSFSAVLLQRNGKIVIGGNFTIAGPVTYRGAVRLNPDSSVDATFFANSATQSNVLSMAQQSDCKIVVSGSFPNGFGSLPRPHMTRILVTDQRSSLDYDGDGRTDISVFRPATGAWYLQRSTDGYLGTNFGSSTDRLAPADYDGDGKTDVAVYRPSTGIWYVTNSSDASVSYHVFGIGEDLPTPADYDGDGKADISVFRPSTGTWYRTNSGDGSFTAVQFGQDGDRPTIGDFDGDGKADVAVFRPSTGAWYQLMSSDGSLFGEQFGNSSDKIAPADYDGDGKTDFGIYRPSEGLWYYKNSSTSTYTPYVFGLADDIPVAGDYDGDGKADIGVFRPADGYWYIVNSGNGAFTIVPWGQNGDRPTPGAFGN